MRLRRHHLYNRVAQLRGSRVAHVKHGESQVRRSEDAILVTAVERLLQNAALRLRIVPVRRDVLKGLASRVVKHPSRQIARAADTRAARGAPEAQNRSC